MPGRAVRGGRDGRGGGCRVHARRRFAAPCLPQPPPAEHAAPQDDSRDPQERDDSDRRAKPVDRGSGPRHSECELTGDLLLGGLRGVEEVVVVALEDERLAVALDDAMQHQAIELGAVVRHDLADLVAAPLLHDGKVAGTEIRLHAVALDQGVGCRPTELARPHEQPEARNECEGDSASENPQGCPTRSHRRASGRLAAGRLRSRPTTVESVRCR